jgi:RNA polymerase sigma-70 factor, ECF subfamily
LLNESDTIRIILRERVEILSYIDSFLVDAHLAEDCFQDVCAAAVSKVETFADGAHVIRWALRVARNKAIDLTRTRNRQPVVLDDEVLDLLEDQWMEQQTGPSEHVADRVIALRKCLDSLTANARRVVDLRYVDGLKSSRIAEILNRKVESVYRVLTRAHAALRFCMENRLPKTTSG